MPWHTPLQAALQQSGLHQQQLHDRKREAKGLEATIAQQGTAIMRMEAQLAEMSTEAQTTHALLARSEQDRDTFAAQLQATQVWVVCCNCSTAN